MARQSLAPPDYPSGPLPRGDGRTVLMIPGFMTGDWSMTRLGAFLSGLGYRVETAQVVFNAGPTPRMIAQLDATLLRLAKTVKVAILGQSLGGVLARDLAQRHPGKVSLVVTLCSPIRFPVTTPLEPFARLMAPLHDPKWIATRHAIAKPLAVPSVAIYSTDDGIVDWRQCLQDEGPNAENIQISGPHCTMGSNPQAQRAVARALARR